MKNRLSLLIIVIITIFTTCKEEPKKIFLDPDFLSYFAFPPGSYWIYEDSATGAIDSSYVVSFERGIWHTYDDIEGEENEVEVENGKYDIFAFDTLYYGSFWMDSFKSFNFNCGLYYIYFQKNNLIFKEINVLNTSITSICFKQNNEIVDTIYLGKNIGIVKIIL